MNTLLLQRDVSRVRQVLSRELDTINEYEQLAREAESDHIRAFFLHLAEEEKEHVAEAVFLLRSLDSGQKSQLDKDFAQAHFQAQWATPAEPPRPLEVPPEPQRVLHALPAPPSPSAGRFTVGSLKGQKL